MLSTSLSLHQLPVALLLSLVATTEVSALVPPTEPALAHAPSSLRGTPTNRQRSDLGGSISLPLKKRHAPTLQSGGDVGAWAKRQGDRLLARYNPAALAGRNDQADSERRGLGHNLITDQVCSTPISLLGLEGIVINTMFSRAKTIRTSVPSPSVPRPLPTT